MLLAYPSRDLMAVLLLWVTLALREQLVGPEVLDLSVKLDHLDRRLNHDFI